MFKLGNVGLTKGDDVARTLAKPIGAVTCPYFVSKCVKISCVLGEFGQRALIPLSISSGMKEEL